MNKKMSKNPILFGVYITKINKKWAILAILCSFIGTGLDRILVIILKNLTDSLAFNTVVMSDIWKWGILFPVIYLIAEWTWRGSGFTGMRWFTDFRYNAYKTLYKYLTHHSKDYFESRFSGSLTNKIANANDGIEDIMARFLWNFFPFIIGLFWYIAFAWLSDYRLGLIIAIWSSLFIALNIFFASKLQKYAYNSAKSLSTLKGKIVDSITNISLVHEHSYIKGETEYVKKYIKSYKEAGLLHWFISEWVLVANGTLIALFILIMIVTSIMLFQGQQITIGVVVMVIVIVTELSHRLLFIGHEMRMTVESYGKAKEGLEEILIEHIIKDSLNAKKIKVLNGEILIDKIDFEYENTKVFKNFSIKIPAGQKIGFVGKSGSGKTTFAALLLRHFDIQKGSIKIDGQNIKNVTLESLRKVIAFVPQDTTLFHRTIKENISYSNIDASEEEIQNAAKLAQADEFIDKLPQGYETLVGERGLKLSGGQRQRIAIARAFLKNSPILILDEATSSLDSESENLIQMSLDKLMKHRTVIAIAHRLSTLRKMDRIIVIEDGKIIEDGSLNDLLKKQKGLFKEMWEHQVKGFILD